MSSCYDGSLSSEIGYIDSVAKEILMRNARDASERKKMERQSELDKVLKRVDNICRNFDSYEYFGKSSGKSSVHYVSDLAELEKVVADSDMKKKYLDDITIFVVGYEKKCDNRLHLIEQVNEFLSLQENLFDSDFAADENVDFEELSRGFEESMEAMSGLSLSLSEIHKEVVSSLVNSQNAKNMNKQKKKLEKALEDSRKQIEDIGAKMQTLTIELQEKDTKLQQMNKQTEGKNSELQKLRAAVEVNRGAANDKASLQSELNAKSEELAALKTDMESLKMDLSEAQHRDQQEMERLKALELDFETKLQNLEDSLANKISELRDSQAELIELRDQQDKRIADIELRYKKKMSALKKKNDDEMLRLQSELRKAYVQMSREDTFDENKQTIFVPEDSFRRGSTSEATDIMEFDDEISFNDEEGWQSVPRLELRGRFAQYRELAKKKLYLLKEQSDTMKKHGIQKREELKTQMNDLGSQWEKQRVAMEGTIKDLEQRKTDAQKQAEAALKRMQEMVEVAKRAHSSKELEGNAVQEKVAALEIGHLELEGKLDSSQHEVKVLQQLLKKSESDKTNALAELDKAKLLLEENQANSKSTLDEEVEKGMRESSSGRKDVDDDDFIRENSDLPFPDDISDAVVSRRRPNHLADHPIVYEFMRTYHHIVETASKLKNSLADKEVYREMSKNLASLKMLDLDKHVKITPQIENLGQNLTYAVDQIFLIVENLCLHVEADRKASLSEEDKKLQAAVGSELKLLREQSEVLHSEFTRKTSDLQSQLEEKDGQIINLQEQMGKLQIEVEKLRLDRQVPLTGALMFTRLDADRNTKSLKQALGARRLSEVTYEEALNQMQEYGSVPARRLLALSMRLMDKRRIEMLSNTYVPDDMVEFSRKLEIQQEKAHQRYVQIMDFLREERLRLARNLTDTFTNVETECSIFLIKPVLSLKHRLNLEEHYKHVMDKRRAREEERRKQLELRGAVIYEEEGQEAPRLIEGKAALRTTSDLSEVWNLTASFDMSTLPAKFDRSMLNTPRLLEMDVSKNLLGQNRVSATVSPGQENLRYYIPMTRHSFDTFPKRHDTVPQVTPLQSAGLSRTTSVVPLPPIKSNNES